jgi:hypothetical protein
MQMKDGAHFSKVFSRQKSFFRLVSVLRDSSSHDGGGGLARIFLVAVKIGEMAFLVVNKLQL